MKLIGIILEKMSLIAFMTSSTEDSPNEVKVKSGWGKKGIRDDAEISMKNGLIWLILRKNGINKLNDIIFKNVKMVLNEGMKAVRWLDMM